MVLVYNDNEVPKGYICTERLYAMLKFKEYKGFIFKCKVYCNNRNIDLSSYIDRPESLRPGWKKLYFLPLDLAIGIVENVRMSNPNRGLTLEHLYTLRGEKVHIQLQDRKAEEFIGLLKNILTSFNIASDKEFSYKGYRIDLYIPSHNIAIEYDEYHHVKHKDIEREKLLVDNLGCKFIRIKDTEDISVGLSKVLTEILTVKS